MAAVCAATFGAFDPARAGPDGCTLANPTATCQGDQSQGITIGNDFPGAYTTLNVNTLTANIAPTPGLNGINFIEAVDITINNDTGAFAIQATNAGSTGIYAESTLATGDVTITSNGDVTGANHAIQAIVIGGMISLTVDGDITATGGDAINATGGNGGGGSATITINSGTITGADDGVEFASILTGTLNNYGTITASNRAVAGDNGDETVNNYGTIVGNVDLGGGTNAFNNLPGATFRPGSTLSLGAGNTLTNFGTLSPGGTGTVQTTALTGNLVQIATTNGNYIVDIDEGGAGADVINVTGTASFGGTVTPNIINITNDTGSVVIANATTLTNSATAASPGTYDFSLSVVGGTQLLLSWAIVSSGAVVGRLPAASTTNQRSLAAHLDGLTAAGASGEMADLITNVVALSAGTETSEALDRMNTEAYLAQAEHTLHGTQQFVKSMMSCPVRDGAFAAIAEDECVWAKVGGNSFEQDRTDGNIGGDSQTWSAAGGIQGMLGGNWRLGTALAYQQTRFESNSSARTDAKQASAGIVVKNRWGPTALAVTGFGGYSWVDTWRPVGVGGITAARGDNGIAFGGLNVRVGYLYQPAVRWYLKPMLDLNATYSHTGDLRETGGGAANLDIEGSDDWSLSASPALELGGEQAFGETLVRPYLRSGVTVFNDRDRSTEASFVSAPGGAGTFTSTSEFDEVYFDVAAGLYVFADDGLNVRVGYDGRFSENTRSHSGSVKLGVNF